MNIATARKKRNKAWKKATFQKGVKEAFENIKNEIKQNPKSYLETHGEGLSWGIDTLANNYNYEGALKDFGYRYNKEYLDEALDSFEREMSEVLQEWMPKGVDGTIMIESDGDYGTWSVVLYVDDDWVEEYAKSVSKAKPPSTKAPKKCPFCGNESYISMAQHNLLCKCYNCGEGWYANEYR